MILRELFEAKAKSVGIIFGRFNPPHMGHMKAWEMASENSTWYVGTNKSTQGPKDPLPFDIKIKAMEAVYPEIKGHIVAEQSWLTLASKVYEKHGNIVLNVYTDEDWVTKAMIQYNGKEGAHGYYEFGTIQQQATPRLSSATALRNAVAADDRDLFGQAAGVDPNTLVAGHPFFDVVKHYLMPHAEKAAAKAVKKKVKEPVAELSSELLGRYKKAAGADAKKSDADGDYARGNKRFSGIVKATKKQFANDEKGVAEGSVDKKPYPKTWHDVDPKIGKLVDKMSPEEKVKKGYSNPSILKKNKEQGVAEVSLGDYRKKATMQKAQSQMGAMFNNDPEKQKQYQDTFNKRDRGLNRLKARDEVARKANADKQMSNNIAKLPELRAEYERMKAEYKALGGSNWQYADRDQNLTDRERKARAMEDPMNNLWRTIQSAEKTQRSADDIAETATPGATSAGMMGTVDYPHISPGSSRGKKSYIGSPGKSGTKAPPQPKVNQPKTKHGTAVNALDMKSNIFGGGKAIKRK